MMSHLKAFFEHTVVDPLGNVDVEQVKRMMDKLFEEDLDDIVEDHAFLQSTAKSNPLNESPIQKPSTLPPENVKLPSHTHVRNRDAKEKQMEAWEVLEH